MTMRAVWSSAVKDLRRQRRDPLALLLSLGIPLLIGSLIVLAFGGRGGPQLRARLLVADEDASLLSDLLIRALGGVPVIDLERVEAAKGREQIDSGEASAFLVIPAGFGSAVLDDRPTTLRLVTNPAQRILPGIVEGTLRLVVDGAFYARRLLDEPLREVLGGPPAGSSTFPDDTIARASAAFNHLVDRLRGYLFPPVIALEVKGGAGEPRTERPLGLLFFPGMLFMGLLFTAQAQSADVWRERQQGTLRRALATPPGIGPLLAGKIVAGTLIMAAIALAALLFGALALGVEGRAIPLAVLWCAFSGTVFLALMLLLQLHASSPRGASMLINMVMFPLLMVGGSMFPFDSMPAWLAAIGRRTPNGWALSVLEAILQRTVHPGALVSAFSALAAVFALALWLSARRLRRRFLAI